jgi:NAD(P)-dependent dehydrogenase (short-subunit alcohol dehydrogenase family)
VHDNEIHERQFGEAWSPVCRGAQAHRCFGARTVAKGERDRMMRNAADEYGPVKIRRNSVRPGFIATEIMEVIPRTGSPHDDQYRRWQHAVRRPEFRALHRADEGRDAMLAKG